MDNSIKGMAFINDNKEKYEIVIADSHEAAPEPDIDFSATEPPF